MIHIDKIRVILTLIMVMSFGFIANAQYSADSPDGKIYKYKPKVEVDVETVFIFNNIENASINYTTVGERVKWYKYVTSASDAVELTASEVEITSLNGKTIYTVKKVEEDRGYFIKEGTTEKLAVWVSKYSSHKPKLISLTTLESEDKCDYLKLVLEKDDDWFVYGKVGNKIEIKREYKLIYRDLTWNEDQSELKEILRESDYQVFGKEYIIDAPLITTTFSLVGDEIGEYFDIKSSITSEEYPAIAVTGKLTANRLTKKEKNPKDDENDLGGSAPIEIEFKAVANEPSASYYTWLIYLNDAKKESAIARYTDKDLIYKFEKSGEYTVVLEISNPQSGCTIKADEVSFKVSETFIDIPNFFTPNGDGSNDIFRVVHRSIITFQATIFTKKGTPIFRWNDPDKGWDGRYKGKIVPSGVYFYVIEYVDTLGEKHRRAGDINILH